MSQDVFAIRREKLWRFLSGLPFDGLLVTNPINVRYLTGFTGEDSYLLFGGGKAILISDGRFTLQIKEECPGVEAFIRPARMHMEQAVARIVRSLRWKSLAFELNNITYDLYSSLEDALKDVKLVPARDTVEDFRRIKDETEIAHIRMAVSQAERAFTAMRSLIVPGSTEKELQNELEYLMRRLGADGPAFPPIVAAGPRAALPHAVPTAQSVDQANCLLVDWGARSNGYCSDLTRVLLPRKVPAKLRKIYQVVLAAQKAAIEMIRPGVAASEVDRAARRVIEDAHLGRFFTHGLGHGLGLEVHEIPRLSVASENTLNPGMVVTVEPGVYIPGLGGVRIEDDVLVTRDGHEVLSHLPKELDEVILDV